MSEQAAEVRHIIGHARTIPTAVLLTAYLKQRYLGLRGEFKYEFTRPEPENGWWSATILFVPAVEPSKFMDNQIHDMVVECRAFAAGRGEIWA